MAAWAWEGTTNEGEFKRGEVDAENKAAAQQRLRAMGVASILALKKKQKDLEIVIPGFNDGVPLKSLVIFTRQMATMIDAGLPLLQCLDMLGNQEPNPNLRKTIMGVKARDLVGFTFVQFLVNFPIVLILLWLLGMTLTYHPPVMP